MYNMAVLQLRSGCQMHSIKLSDNLDIPEYWSYWWPKNFCYQNSCLIFQMMQTSHIRRIWYLSQYKYHVCCFHDFNSSPPSAAYMRWWTGSALYPIWCQAITWTNARLFSTWPLGTNFSEILFKIQSFSLKKVQLKMSSAKWRPFCPGEMS